MGYSRYTGDRSDRSTFEVLLRGEFENIEEKQKLVRYHVLFE